MTEDPSLKSDANAAISLWRKVFLYGLALGFALAVIKLMEFSFFARNIRLEIYLGTVALIFLLAGVLFGRRFFDREGQESPELLDRSPVLAQTPVLEPTTQRKPIGGELTEREMQVLVRLAEGATNREIGEALFLSPNTIKTHVTNLYRKLDVSRRPQAVTRARELGILK